MIVSNIGITPDLFGDLHPQLGQHTAFVQVSLKEDHSSAALRTWIGCAASCATDLPELSTYFQTGGLVDSIVNHGLPAPIDIQVSSNDMKEAYDTAARLRRQHQARCKGSAMF